MKWISSAFLSLVFLLPYVAYAQARNFSEFVTIIIGILNLVVPLVFGIAVIGFLWGGAHLILHADSEEQRTKGRSLLVWGIIALFVMVSVWGILGILINSFGLPTSLP